MFSNRLFWLKPVQPFLIIVVLLFLKSLLFREYLFNRIAWSQVVADLASIVAFVGLFEAISPIRARKYVRWTLNLIVSFLFFASVVYFNYFSTIPTYSALNELHQVGGVKDSVNAAIEPKDYWFFADVAVLALGWLAWRIRGLRAAVGETVRRSFDKAWRLGTILAAIAGLLVSQSYIRNAASIENELAQAEEVGFFNYQVSAAMNRSKPAIEVKGGGTVGWSEQLSDLIASNPNVRANTKDPAGFGKMAGKNVIVIQLEAFQNFPIHLKVGDQLVTPILNELADNGYYFPHFFQQIGQGNTSDAEFMSNTSIYPTAKVAMSTGYGDRDLPSLPKLLETRGGYAAETFHVNDVTFWDRNKLYPALGFDKYFDRPSFENDNFNGFGASDEQLYKTAVKRMAELKQENKPFYMQMITASSHHPFKIPEDKQWLTLPEEIAGTQLGDYLEAVHYTDYAIGELIKMLKENDLYNDTMLVIYGDHFGLQPQDNDPADLSEKLGITYHERISRFNIPLIIRVPGDAPRQVIQTVGGQVDIMPTIANLLGISLKDEDYVAFGHDLLNTHANVFGMRYYMPTGSFFNNDIMFVPGKSFEDGMAWSLDTMEPVPDFSAYRGDYDYVLKLMKLSDAYVESLPMR